MAYLIPTLARARGPLHNNNNALYDRPNTSGHQCGRTGAGGSLDLTPSGPLIEAHHLKR